MTRRPNVHSFAVWISGDATDFRNCVAVWLGLMGLVCMGVFS